MSYNNGSKASMGPHLGRCGNPPTPYGLRIPKPRLQWDRTSEGAEIRYYALHWTMGYGSFNGTAPRKVRKFHLLLPHHRIVTALQWDRTSEGAEITWNKSEGQRHLSFNGTAPRKVRK